MKKYLLFLIMLSALKTANGQWSTPDAYGNIYNTNLNNVGIGNSSPAYPLDILRNVNGTTAVLFSNPSTGSLARTRFVLSNGSNYSVINLNGSNYPTDPNSLSIGTPSSTSGSMILQTSGGERLRIDQYGNVGIGTSTPRAMLDVAGAVQIAGVAGTTPPNGLSYGLFQYTGVGLGFYSASSSPNQGMAFWTDLGGSPMEAMRIRAGGQVLIGVGGNNFGNINVGSNMLAVGGGVITEAITVKTEAGGWPDYVFKAAYTLRPLCEVKTYIDKNHHLPEMPSQADIAKNGQNLGEMNKLLVKKVEELTLYLIDQTKDIKKQSIKLITAETTLRAQNLTINRLSNRLKALEGKH